MHALANAMCSTTTTTTPVVRDHYPVEQLHIRAFKHLPIPFVTALEHFPLHEIQSIPCVTTPSKSNAGSTAANASQRLFIDRICICVASSPFPSLRYAIERAAEIAQQALERAACINLQRFWRGYVAREIAGDRREELLLFLEALKREEAEAMEEEYYKLHPMEKLKKEMREGKKKKKKKEKQLNENGEAEDSDPELIEEMQLPSWFNDQYDPGDDNDDDDDDDDLLDDGYGNDIGNGQDLIEDGDANANADANSDPDADADSFASDNGSHHDSDSAGTGGGAGSGSEAEDELS